MKKLICVADIKAAAEQGQRSLSLTKDTLLTPAARDLARELGVGLIEANNDKPANQLAANDDGSTLDQLDPSLICRLVKAVLTQTTVPAVPFTSVCDPQSGLEIIRGRSVQFAPLTAAGTDKVCWRELFSRPNGVTAGLLTIEQTVFKRPADNETVLTVLEGMVNIVVNDRLHIASQGDVVMIPPGSSVRLECSGFVKLFCISYPG